jgi:transposase-like protein
MAGRKTKIEANRLKSEVRDLLENGHNVSSIAEITSCQPSTIRRYVDEVEAETGFSNFEGEDITDIDYVSYQETQCRKYLERELTRAQPNHLLVEKLSNRQIKLLELKSQLQHTPTVPEFNTKNNLSDDQLNRIADIIASD